MQYFRVELHCHTYHSPDCLLHPNQILEQCKRIGIDRIAITDHNAIQGAYQAAAIDPERVIIGEEIMTTGGELLGYFLQEFVPPNLSPKETISILRAQGAFVSVAHPFDYTRKGAWKREELLDILNLLDAIEIFNARTWSSTANNLAATLASQQDMLATAGSDAHTAFEIGRAAMSIPHFLDAESLRLALSTAQIHARRSTPLVHLFSRYATFRKALGWKPG